MQAVTVGCQSLSNFEIWEGPKPMSFGDIRKQLVVDEAVKALRDAIVKGRLEPGQRLLQSNLADTLGISRTPIREALLALEREGLVKRMGRQGMVVTQLFAKDVLEMYEIREVLEGLAARLAAHRATRSQLEALRKSIERMVGLAERQDPWKWLQTNQSFHDIMIRASQNERLVQTLSAVPIPLLSLSLLVWSRQDRPALAYQEHACVYEALVARKPAEAEELARAHIRAVSTAVVDAVKQQEIRGTSKLEAASKRDGKVRPWTG